MNCLSFQVVSFTFVCSIVWASVQTFLFDQNVLLCHNDIGIRLKKTFSNFPPRYILPQIPTIYDRQCFSGIESRNIRTNKYFLFSFSKSNQKYSEKSRLIQYSKFFMKIFSYVSCFTFLEVRTPNQYF